MYVDISNKLLYFAKHLNKCEIWAHIQSAEMIWFVFIGVYIKYQISVGLKYANMFTLILFVNEQILLFVWRHACHLIQYESRYTMILFNTFKVSKPSWIIDLTLDNRNETWEEWQCNKLKPCSVLQRFVTVAGCF